MKCSVLVVVALFALVSANPVPASDDLQLVQIPLQGNKVSHPEKNTMKKTRTQIGPADRRRPSARTKRFYKYVQKHTEKRARIAPQVRANWICEL